ncbi:ankyrin repeat domain-containing protein 27-like [Anthonomus grandis grandis]|uniref:ankyrin repeat domain-containing protein 27-like n=1 Tax=Anthonomus grandis grandis TaxID=2921223 RepID=UPI0021663C4D|nr:ankyrin repeat domain-containing protein 27-like [Anthonomus grandis grandis]
MLLISDKANVNLVDCNKNTALHLACDRGHDSCVKALIYSSHFVEINLQNSLGETPLFLATKWGYFDIIKILLENGAAVCFKNNRNLSIYKLSPNYYVSNLFEQFGNQKSKNLAKEVIDDKTSDSTSEKCYELPLSSKEGHRMQNFLFGTRAKNASEEKRIQLLLKAIEDNDMPLTSFYLGYTGNLVDKGDVSTDSSNITTKCHPLCACNKCCAGDFLDSESVDHTSHKLNVNVSNDEGYTPLHVAAKFGRTDILRILLDGGAYLNVRTNKTFHTPLHLAVMFQRVQAVKELLNCGHCEIDAQDLRGNTPLYYACIQNNSNLKILEYLLKNGADCQKKNFEEKTVLQICEEKNLFRVCRLLKENMERLSPITKDSSLSHSFSTISFDDIDSDFEIL